VWLDAEETSRFYEGFSNGVLWPLFHYLLDQMPLHVEDWEVYQRVNERFADAVAACDRPGDLVWVHDYQLTLVPKLLRARPPEARIGFFLHIPFPASGVFRILPVRERLLEGLLGADLVGFHTAAYMRHFAPSRLRILGIAADVDRVRFDGREVRLGVLPDGHRHGESSCRSSSAWRGAPSWSRWGTTARTRISRRAPARGGDGARRPGSEPRARPARGRRGRTPPAGGDRRADAVANVGPTRQTPRP
jgi:trehalose 6-phosphate synthase/phosphatase